MESLRRYDDQADNEAATMLLQRTVDESPPANNEVTYAQIVRPDRVQVFPQSQPQSQSQLEEDIDFRLQTPAQHAPANYQHDNPSNASPLTSGASSISSGYIDLTHPYPRVQRRNWRPTSPETSF